MNRIRNVLIISTINITTTWNNITKQYRVFEPDVYLHYFDKYTKANDLASAKRFNNPILHRGKRKVKLNPANLVYNDS